jgi:hypothetical protein
MTQSARKLTSYRNQSIVDKANATTDSNEDTAFGACISAAFVPLFAQCLRVSVHWYVVVVASDFNSKTNEP